MYWDKLLREVVGKNKTVQKLKHVNFEVCDNVRPFKQLLLEHKGKRNYRLGPRYRNAYFTKREAECMIMLLRGKTIHKVALALRLSPRTIEFYLKNMKAKIGCKTKFELIEKVLESNFLQNVDFV